MNPLSLFRIPFATAKELVEMFNAFVLKVISTLGKPKVTPVICKALVVNSIIVGPEGINIAVYLRLIA